MKPVMGMHCAQLQQRLTKHSWVNTLTRHHPLLKRSSSGKCWWTVLVGSEILGQVTAVFAETCLSASPSPEPNLESQLLSSAGAPMLPEHQCCWSDLFCSTVVTVFVTPPIHTLQIRQTAKPQAYPATPVLIAWQQKPKAHPTARSFLFLELWSPMWRIGAM